MTDLAFFLDKFGSTQAVRLKLQEQEKDIKRLEKQVRRLLIGQEMAVVAQEERERNSERNSPTNSGNNEEDVGSIMANLHFFLQTFGSTRAVRQKLESQCQQIAGLKRTAQWFQERQGKAAQVTTPEKVSSLNAGPPRPEEKEVTKMEIKSAPSVATEHLQTLKNTDSNTFKTNIGAETKTQTEDSTERTEEAANPGIKAMSKAKTRCSQPGCKKTVQVYGLCYHHGGYYTCTFKDCNRRAVTKYLCHLHGGGKVCRQPDCIKRIVSSGKEFCNRHAREQACMTDGCNNFQVNRGYCDKHNLEKAANNTKKDGISPCDHQAPAPETHPSTSRLHHQTCRAAGCMKWVMRNGDPNVYCIVHRNGSTTESSSSGMPATLKVPIDTVDVQPTKVSKEMDDLKSENRVCKLPRCTNLGNLSGPKKGFCFRHGGWLTCIVEGCTKKRQRNKRCAAHGGYYDCKAEGCKKRAYLRGFCKSHFQERFTLGQGTDNEGNLSSGQPQFVLDVHVPNGPLIRK
ncbi:hypothetical protein V7S43_016814 [Phytophthora oleae]|uniref:WRKY19-like zinc finger domain-containing protein n=1 Tax=Phytophthora oleae TaxID=2107226 RepID=A0ABD3EVJ7_9STRA